MNCVCGCPSEHPGHCIHGCTLPQPDNGIEPVGGTVPQDKYDGFYANKKWSA